MATFSEMLRLVKIRQIANKVSRKEMKNDNAANSGILGAQKKNNRELLYELIKTDLQLSLIAADASNNEIDEIIDRLKAIGFGNPLFYGYTTKSFYVPVYSIVFVEPLNYCLSVLRDNVCTWAEAGKKLYYYFESNCTIPLFEDNRIRITK